jgi:serine/threonine-protein kinase
VLLFELLTGHHSTGTRPRTPADLVKAIVDTEPARLSDTVALTRSNAEITTANAASRATTPDKLRRLLRGDLDTIVAKALKEEPIERYPSVTALADDLRRYLRSGPIGLDPILSPIERPSSFAATAWPWPWRHWQLWPRLLASRAR